MVELFSVREAKEFLDFSKKNDSVEKLKKQRTMSRNFLNCFSPKHYPRIFLDQRLRSRFKEHAPYKTKRTY